MFALRLYIHRPKWSRKYVIFTVKKKKKNLLAPHHFYHGSYSSAIFTLSKREEKVSLKEVKKVAMC